MKTYLIRVRETHVMDYEVHAESEDSAREKWERAEGGSRDNPMVVDMIDWNVERVSEVQL